MTVAEAPIKRTKAGGNRPLRPNPSGPASVQKPSIPPAATEAQRQAAQQQLTKLQAELVAAEKSLARLDPYAWSEGSRKNRAAAEAKINS